MLTEKELSRLFALGFPLELYSQAEDPALAGFLPARVIREHRERYIVSDGAMEYEAEITGNLRYSATSRAGFPAVGDWVLIRTYDNDQAIIHRVLPRKSILARRAVGKYGEEQIIATNIDVAFIVQAINNNFSINRLERYLAICHSSGIEPVLIISKTDLSSDEKIGTAVSAIEKREKELKYLLLSNVNLNGLDRIMEFIRKGKTYCVVGSSGVGKSTLINNLMKKDILKTGHISQSSGKGRHMTEHRELIVLENGGIIIDNPGMKELGMTEDEEGINTTFHAITDLERECRYMDCKHINESGCAVIEAVKNGLLNKGAYDNYLKMHKEQQRFQASAAEKHKKDRAFGKMLKNYHKDLNKNQE